MERIVIDITSDPTKLQATIDQLNKMGAVDAKNAQQFKKNNQDFNTGLQNAQKEASLLSQGMNKIGQAIIAAFAVERVFAFGKAIIDTRAEFQKFEAQLETALGSKGAAKVAMDRIQRFAAETPFSVKELTESFVRLANRGINATNEQFRKLGDVAASLGKPMEQVIEAVLDINNTERWNELGIKVKTNGDKITGTFKGMTVEAARTEEGAMKMIEAFGGMENVAGGMQRQMETLNGTMSNFGDNLDNIMNQMGRSVESGFSGIMGYLNGALSVFGERMKQINDINEVFAKSNIDNKYERFHDVISSFNMTMPSYAEAFAVYNQKLNKTVETFDEAISKIDKTNQALAKKQALDAYGEAATDLKVRIAAVNDEYSRGQITFQDAQKEIALINNATSKLKGTYDAFGKALDISSKNAANHANALKKTHTATKEYQDILPPLVKKLQDLQMAYREIDVSRLENHEKLNAQRKIDDEKAENSYNEEIDRIQKLYKEKKITQDMFQKASSKALEIYEQEKLNIQKKFGYATEDLDRELALKRAEHLKKLANMEISMMEMGRDNEEEIYDLRIKTVEDYYNKLIELEKDQEKREELIQQKRLELAKIDDDEKKRKLKAIEDERNEARRHEIAMMEITEQGEKEILKKKMEYSAEDLDRMREDFGEGSDEYQKELNHYLELEAEFNKKSKEGKKEWVKDWVSGINEVLQAMLNALNNMVEAEMNANNIRMDNQREILETQRTLAAKGLENTLAFEQKRNDEMAKQQIDLQRKQQRIKELQIFLNAMAKFAEEDPKSALTKALSLIAATKVAETIFAEEGAIVGTHETKFRGQRHRSGRDRIAIVEDGEVILPKAKAMEMGLNSKSKFSQFLKTPFSEKIMPVAVAQHDNYDKLAREMKELKEIIRNKQEVSINWDNFDTRIETRIKGSLKEVTKVKKSRI